MLRKDHSTDNSTTAEAGAHVTNVRINLGGPTVALVIFLLIVLAVAAWIIGQNTAERAHQERESRGQADQLQREMARDAAQIAREWAKQTGELTEAMSELKRQYRMTELKLDDWTVVAHRRGLVLPGDYTRGPQGNLDRESFQAPFVKHPLKPETPK